MKFNEIKKTIDSYLGEAKIFSPEHSSQIKECFGLISNDIHRMIDGDELEQNKKKFDTILNTTLLISSRVLDAPLNNDFSIFVSAYAELIFNWNSNLYKDEVLRQMSLYMSRMIDVRTTILQTTSVLKDVDDRMRDLSSWTPPAYDISREYFELLLNENEKE